jgi:sensor histidine kinase YesM
MKLKQLILNKIGQIILHILFWGLTLLFYTYFFSYNSNNLNYILSFSLFLMPITIATTYVSIYYLIPKYLVTKKYFLFTLYSLYTFITSAYLIIISVFYGLIYLSKFDYNEMAPISRNLFFVMLSVYLVTIIVSAIKLLKINFKQTEKTSSLEKKILKTQLKLKEQELNYLKMQIHPHFLFNTLNTMYGFALKKANETPEMILKLSNLLDYLLYKVDKPLVLLTDELNHIEDYIELEKMRFSDTLSLSLEKNNISNTINIAPMLLLPFIENSFKHGTIMEGKLNIEIKISCYENNVDFYIKNSYSNNDNSSQGIGLKNIKKRLNLLYKDKYTLNINKADSFFEVHLILKSQ